MKERAVTAEVAGRPDEVFGLLCDIRNHLALSCRALDLVEVSHDGRGRMLGVIDLRGPLGVRRRITTREVIRHSPAFIWGVAASSSGSLADVRWDVERVSDVRTRVSLSVLPVRVGLVDRGLLIVGGRLVLSGILRDTLRRLEALLPLDDLPGKTPPVDAANSI